MTLLLEFVIKISLVVALGLLAALLLRRHSAALRHWLLASAIASALATPLLIGVAPSWTLPIAAPASTGESQALPPPTGRTSRIAITTTTRNESATAVPAERRIQPVVVLLTLWIVGLVVNLAGLLVGF